jgi:hypothetical protein
VPAEGENVMTTMDPNTRAAVEPTLQAGVYSPGAGAGLEMLCNDLDEEQTSFVVRSRTDDSVRLLTDPMDLTGLRTPVPRWWIGLNLDQRVPPSLQHDCNARWGGRVLTLDTGHMAMVADPVGLAAHLNAIRAHPRRVDAPQPGAGRSSSKSRWWLRSPTRSTNISRVSNHQRPATWWKESR